MDRCQRCHRPATRRVVTAKNLLLLGVAGSKLTATFRHLVFHAPACDDDIAWFTARRAPGELHDRLISWTTPALETP